MYQRVKVVGNRIGSAGLKHLSKSRWKNIESMNLCLKLLIMRTIDWALMQLGNLFKPTGLNYATLIYVTIRIVRLLPVNLP